MCLNIGGAIPRLRSGFEILFEDLFPLFANSCVFETLGSCLVRTSPIVAFRKVFPVQWVSVEHYIFFTFVSAALPVSIHLYPHAILETTKKMLLWGISVSGPVQPDC